MGLAYHNYKDEIKITMPSILTPQAPSSCEFRDRNMIQILDLVEAGIPALEKKHPGFKKPRLTYGLRGIRYFLEFPVINRKVDAFSYIVNTEKTIQMGKSAYKSKVTSTDSFSQGDNVAYMIDYQTKSSGADGAHCKGSVYLRGVRSEGSFDSFKFVMEKSNDFC